MALEASESLLADVWLRQLRYVALTSVAWHKTI